jgi:methionine synthase II (cobalamin-independent)
MTINESMEQALAQARELEQSISDAVNKAIDQIKPQVASSLHIARDLQVTFTKHMDVEAELIVKNTSDALSHLDEYMALGAQAMQDTSDHMRSIAKKMVQQSMKVVEAAAAAASSAAGKAAAPSTAVPSTGVVSPAVPSTEESSTKDV